MPYRTATNLSNDLKEIQNWALQQKISFKPDASNTAQKMKFSIKDFFSTCDQIRRKRRIWSHLLKKSLMKNFIFCAVNADTRNSFQQKEHQDQSFSKLIHEYSSFQS